ncbi:MAG: endonuclease III, partial [Actinobacteria bacterium]|nr:endonuclease III [Actinomycetota bacterium]
MPAHARVILRGLKKDYPVAVCELTHESPFQLLAATILSAQCTDARVNMTTPALFAAYPTAQAMALADIAHVEQLVKSTGFY